MHSSADRPHARRPRQGRAGFSLVEAAVSAAVLGIALTALVRAQLSTVQGVGSSEDTIVARSLARGVADLEAGIFRATGVVANPACEDLTPGFRPTYNCADSQGFVAPVNPACVRNFELVTLGGENSSPEDLGLPANPFPNTGFRVDIFSSVHPDPAVPPAAARVFDVVVCWRDALSPNIVRQIREVRVVRR